MKQLLFGDLELSAEKIYKYEDSIIGITNNVEVFSFKGVNDFTEFKLADDEEFDVPAVTEIEKLRLEQAQANSELVQLIMMMGGA